MSRSAFYWVPGLGVLALLLGAFGIPMGVLFREGAGAASLAAWDQSWFLHVLAFTYGQAALSAVLSAVVGTAGALLYSEVEFPGRRWLWRLSLISFSLPTILVVLALLGFWGSGGLLNRAWAALGGEGALVGDFFGWPGILVGHVFFNFPLFLKYVGTALVEMDRDPERAALSLGAPRWYCLFFITGRKAWPAFRSALFLAFVYCSLSFLIVLLLGGGPRFTTIEVAIYQAVKTDFDLNAAVRLAAVQMVISLTLYGLFLRHPVPAVASRGKPGVSLYAPRARWARRLSWMSYFVLLSALVGGPVLSLLAGSLGGWSRLEGEGLARAFLNSVRLAACTGALAVAAAYALARLERHGGSSPLRSLAGLAATLPLSVSTLVLTLAWVVWVPELRWALRGYLLPVAVVQSLVCLPLVYRPLRDALERIPDSLYRAALASGASPWQILTTLELPLLRNALGLAFVMAAAFSLGEIGAVVLFLTEEMATLPLWIFRLMGRYRFAEAYAVGTVLLGGMTLLYLLMGYWEERDKRTGH